MDRLLKVQGKGIVNVHPDTVILSFHVESKAKEYEESIHKLNMRADDLRDRLTASGLDKAQLKTTEFNVQAENQYKDGKSVFIGYVASHRLQIELPMDTELLNQVLHQVAQGQSGAEIMLTFSVKDKPALRSRVLAQAVRTAMENASTLAKSAGVSLGKLLQVDYGWAEVHIYDRQASVVAQKSSRMVQFDANIEPADVTAEDHVTLTFENTGG